jgi:hypothetical protein
MTKEHGRASMACSLGAAMRRRHTAQVIVFSVELMIFFRQATHAECRHGSVRGATIRCLHNVHSSSVGSFLRSAWRMLEKLSKSTLPIISQFRNLENIAAISKKRTLSFYFSQFFIKRLKFFRDTVAGLQLECFEGLEKYILEVFISSQL